MFSCLLLVQSSYSVSFCCLTSTEARRPIRDGDEWEKGDRRVTAARTTELRQCLSGIAQRPPHHAIAVPNAVQNRVTKTMSVAPPLGNNGSKKMSNSLSSPASPPCS